MSDIGKHVTGLQHIGLPTNDMAKTLAFYEKLGFELAYQTVNNGEKVCFLKLANVCIETYENGQAVGAGPAPSTTSLWMWMMWEPPGPR